jgi:serine/threonine protein kinase
MGFRVPEGDVAVLRLRAGAGGQGWGRGGHPTVWRLPRDSRGKGSGVQACASLAACASPPLASPALACPQENTLLQKVNGLPLPLLKICDFGYSKADFKSAAKSKVRRRRAAQCSTARAAAVPVWRRRGALASHRPVAAAHRRVPRARPLPPLPPPPPSPTAPHGPQVGTLTYMAPEVLVNRDGKYNGKVRRGGGWGRGG